jgi:hypothetical protein
MSIFMCVEYVFFVRIVYLSADPLFHDRLGFQNTRRKSSTNIDTQCSTTFSGLPVTTGAGPWRATRCARTSRRTFERRYVNTAFTINSLYGKDILHDVLLGYLATSLILSYVLGLQYLGWLQAQEYSQTTVLWHNAGGIGILLHYASQTVLF